MSGTTVEIKIYAWCIALLPILSSFNSFIPNVDIGTLLLVIFGCYGVIRFHTLVINRSIFVLQTYVMLVTVLNLIMSTELYSSETSVLMRMMRFIILITITVNIGGYFFFDRKVFIDIYRRIVIVTSLYAIIQFLAYNFFGRILPNISGKMVWTATEAGTMSSYRPASFFGEPSNYAYYVVPFLCVLLFCSEYQVKNRIIDIVIVVLGLICTASSQGIICIGVIAVYFIIKQFRQGINSKTILLILLTTLFLYVFLTNERVLFSLNRLSSEHSYSAVDARIGGYYAFLNLGIVQKIFGTGFGNYIQMVYYSSIADILFCTGIIGLIIVVGVYINAFVKGFAYQRAIIVSSLVLMLGGGIYTASLLCLYWSLMLNFGDDDFLFVGQRE